MKKLAVIFYGISYLKNYKHRDRFRYNIDYNDSYLNYQTYIFNYFKMKGYTCNIYYVTNNIEDKEKLEECYKPIKCNYIDIDDTNYHYCKNIKLVNAIDLCLKENIIYDHCLITRFDLLFNDTFDNLNYEKINLISILEKPTYICDNFYFMPYSLLSKFYDVCLKNIKISHHHIQSDIENVSSIHYLKNEYVIIQHLSFYKIFHYTK